MKTGLLGHASEPHRVFQSRVPVAGPAPTLVTAVVAFRSVSPDTMGIKATASLVQRFTPLAGEGQPTPEQSDDLRRREMEVICRSITDRELARVNDMISWRARMWTDLAAMRKRIEDLWAHHQKGVRARDLLLEHEQAAQLARLANQDADSARRRRSGVQVERAPSTVLSAFGAAQAPETAST